MLCNEYVFTVQDLRGLLILAPSTFEDMSIMETSISTDIHWTTWEDCHFKFHNWNWDPKVVRTQNILSLLAIIGLLIVNVHFWTLDMVYGFWAQTWLSSSHMPVFLVSILAKTLCQMPLKLQTMNKLNWSSYYLQSLLCITLLRFITMLCGTDSILHNIPHIQS